VYPFQLVGNQLLQSGIMSTGPTIYFVAATPDSQALPVFWQLPDYRAPTGWDLHFLSQSDLGFSFKSSRPWQKPKTVESKTNMAITFI